MREPVEPGWAEKQTPTPFLYHKLTWKQLLTADSGVFIGLVLFLFMMDSKVTMQSCERRDSGIKSLVDFFSELKKIESDGVLLFRGLASKEYKLIPAIGRKKKGSDDYQYDKENEEQMFLEFKRRYSLFTDDKPSSDIDILFLAQHFGVPTRLLDWTYNSLVALYFACQKNDDKFGCVYVYRIPPQSTFIKEGHERDFDFFNPDNYNNDYMFIIPDYTNRRFANQKGMFMMFKDPYNQISDEMFRKINISNKEEILKELDLIGITESVIYPTLDSLGKEIANKYKKV